MGVLNTTNTFFIVSICAFLAFVICDVPSNAPELNVGKAHDGLSTASDTLAKEARSISIDGFSAEQLAVLRQQSQTYQFQAEVNRMMSLIINSLYKNKEIFLRELISNASDALDKIRVQALTDKDALSATPELSIRVKADKDKKTLHIMDTGIGMSSEELMSNLGTIAKSGTSEFLSKLASSQSPTETTDLIGQFGVGFYSAFLVSDKVVVISKKNDHDQYVWESDSSSFSISKDPRSDTLKRGTEVILYLKDEASDFLEPDALKSLIKKYSQFINFPIYLWSSRVETVAEDADEKSEVKTDAEEVSVEEDKKDAPKTVEKTVWDWVHVNKYKPIWKRKVADVTEKDYNELYQALSVDQDEPLAKVHFTGEGSVTFTAVIYIPKRAHGDPFSDKYNYKDRIKLHVHRVFISDAAEELVPKYLGFVVGIVDSDDLPLNVSREMLQQSQLLKVVRKKIQRKIIEMISKLSEEDYEKFWKEYSLHIKLGMISDDINKVKLSKLLRYRTSKSADKLISLSDYVSRMKPGQDVIYYLVGSSLEEVKSSPLGERLIKKGYEIVYMTDAMDTFVMQGFTEFDKKRLQNIAKEGVKLETSETTKARQEADQKDYSNLLKWLQEKALSGKIVRAELSERLSDSPVALVAAKHGWSGDMERVMRAQAFHRGDDSSASYYASMPKILEINPRHPLIKELNMRVKTDSSDKEALETAELLLQVAALRSGYTLQDSNDFIRKVEVLLRKNLGVDVNEETEVEPEEPTESGENTTKPTTDEETDSESTHSSKPEAPNNSDKTSNDCPTCRRVLHFDAAETETDGDDDSDEELYDAAGFDVREQDDDDEGYEEEEEDVIEEDSETIGSRKLLFVKQKPDQKKAATNSSPKKKGKSPSQPKVPNPKIPANAPKVAQQVKPKPAIPKSKPVQRVPLKKATHISDYATLKAFHSRQKQPVPKPKIKPRRVVGTINDHDCDGIPDDIDEDIDNDGLLDRTQDSDWDGELNHVDLDDDNDGIFDVEDEDANGDGIPDCRLDTSDHNLMIRFKKKKHMVDSDSDGIPDVFDRDDDDDGIPDMLEDEDGDQIPDVLKLTRKDVSMKADHEKIRKYMAKHGWHDHDCDGIPDDLDPDDDNDGYFDNKQDSDRDGILNEWDDDDDNDGIPDAEDPDSNGDGIADCIMKDSDGDGIPDHIDTDDDNDGIPDFRDPDHPAFNYLKDSDRDGIPDIVDKDDDNDGIPDHRDHDADGDGTDDFFQDIDKDGVPDSLDDDMNNDGIPDYMQDHDCDGIPDIIDPDDDNDGYFDNKQDSDNDGILNEWDDDDDNDGIPDSEDPDSNGDGIIDCQPRDSDGDGIPDHLDDDDDNDGVPDIRDPDSVTFLLYKHKQFLEAIPAELARDQANIMNVDLGDPNDKDCDGIPDHLDNDLDNDGKIDRTQDSDMDGMLNHVDDDDDNDGIPDHLDPDANGDGIPDCRRDGDLHYKLVKSPSGLVKKVLRIRKPTQEEQYLTYMVNEAKRAIAAKHRIRKPPILKRRKLVKAGAESKYGNNNEAEGEEIPHVARPIPSKTIHGSMPNNPKANKIATKQSSDKIKQPGLKTKIPQNNRKLAEHNVDESKVLWSAETPTSADEDDQTVDYLDLNEGMPDAPAFFPGAMAADTKLINKLAAQKLKAEQQSKQAKPAPNTAKQKLGNQVKSSAPAPKTDPKTGTCKVGSCQKSNLKYTVPKQVPATKIHQNVNDDDDDDEGYIEDEDEDGIPDYLEGDSDGDGIPDYMEDEDGDGIPDYLEDEDGDGVPDYLDEDSSYFLGKLYSDKNGNGIPDHLEGDSDGDGILDYLEDTDGDGIPDYLEDSDGDGVPDYLDTDTKSQFGPKKLLNRGSKHDYDLDHDGIPDFLEGDSDGDGVPDYLEDSDGNGVPDYLEDSDGDGIPDYQDEDANTQFSAKNIRILKARMKTGDIDNDGIPDHLEGDSDGDGIPDYMEDNDGDGIPDYLEDSDGDGIPDYLDEDANTQFSPKVFKKLKELKMKEDEDGDGIPDYLEGDSDGDGIPDYLEDSDGDGIPDYLEDSDGDGIPDYLDEDSLLQKSKSIFKIEDKNKNGIPDHLERDSDYDGTPDYLEDSDGDGIPDYMEDSDGDGVPDYLDEDATTQFSPKKIRGRARGKKFADADGDGIPDHLEGDLDGNGIPDYLEDADNDSIPDYLEDTDGDGIPDYLDEDATTKFAPRILRSRKPQRRFADVDGDGIPDHLEEDNDGDGIPDYLEDTDGDGIPDYLEDSDGDGIPDYIDEDATSQFSPKSYRRLKLKTQFEDTDGDGIPDHLQGDSDGDGVLDFLEDSDGDGIPDYLEDTDGDGIPDYLDEDAESQFSPRRFTDKNRDGIPDSLEGDSDGDGIPDYMEDTDGDGIPDYLEDSDGDGIPNYLDSDVVDVETEAIVEKYDADTNKNGIPDYLEDWDGDGIPNYLDDDDGDGIADFLDKKDNRLLMKKGKKKSRDFVDENLNGIPDHLEGDSDGDGVLDYKQDRDKDGIPDYLDTDDPHAKFRKKNKVGKHKKKTDVPNKMAARGKVVRRIKDTDGDGIPDHLDDDADGDGIPDNKRKVAGRKWNVLKKDSELKDTDGDGIPDLYDNDDDNDGVPDDEDDDDDNDGIKDHHEDADANQMLDILEHKDTDGDGIPDYLDTDDDNDGIPDEEDTDDDGDGIIDLLDTDDDNDQIPDHLDNDDDGDGIPDDAEDENQNKIPDVLEIKAAKQKPTINLSSTKKKPFNPNGKSASKAFNQEDDDDDDDNIEDSEEAPSAFRIQVNRILRWIESVVGVEE